MNQILLLALPMLLAVGCAHDSSHPVSAFPSTRDESGALIRDLASSDPDVRERSTYELIEIGEPALPSLREALKSSDAEVRARAAFILQKIDWTMAESKLDLFLKSEKIDRSKMEQRDIRDTCDWAAEILLYRVTTSSPCRLVALRKDGEAILSKPFTEGEQDFVVEVLKNVRVKTDEERLQAARLCLVVLDQFAHEPGSIAGDRSLEIVDSADGHTKVGFGIFLSGAGFSKEPSFAAEFDSAGRICCVSFICRD